MSIFDTDIWMPELIEILKYQEDEKELPPEKQYFSKFGFNQIEVPADCPLVAALMPELTYRFNLKYKYMMLGAETMEQWQSFLEDNFLDKVHRFERGLAFYANNKALMEDVVGYSEHYAGNSLASGADTIAKVIGRQVSGSDSVDRNVTSTLSGTDARTGSNNVTLGGQDSVATTSDENTSGEDVAKFSNTPDSAINASDDYAQSVQKNTTSGHSNKRGSETTTYGKTEKSTDSDSITYGKKETNVDGTTTTYGKKDDVSDDTTTTYGKQDSRDYDITRLNKAEVTDAVNHAVEAWIDLECQFVDSFQNCFLGIFGY